MEAYTRIVQERKDLLNEAEALAKMGSWRWVEADKELICSEGLYKVLNKELSDEITWNTFLENVVQEDVPLVKECLHEVINNCGGATIDYRIVYNGKVQHLSLTVKSHYLQTSYVLGTIVDITNRKEQEEQLKALTNHQKKTIKVLNEKEQKYRTLFERSIDPIFLTTRDLMLTDVNDAFLNFFGFLNLSVIPHSMAEIFTKVEDFLIFQSRLKDTGQVRDFEISLRTHSGETRICLVNCVIIPDQSSSASCYQGIIHDLTLRKLAEREMILAERLSITGRIARTIAHEVRNPLTNLNLALDQLRGEMPIENESAKFYCEIIERNANRIAQLVDEMLDSSKPQQLHLVPCSINDLIEETVLLANDRLQLNQMNISVDLQNDLKEIIADKAKLPVALLNIFINAIEAMVPGEGILTIRTQCENESVLVSIADNGKGVSEADIPKLFDPFYTGKDTGVGLGLTSTKNILNGHGASITVSSVLGNGTRFEIRFKEYEQPVDNAS